MRGDMVGGLVLILVGDVGEWDFTEGIWSTFINGNSMVGNYTSG